MDASTLFCTASRDGPTSYLALLGPDTESATAAGRVAPQDVAVDKLHLGPVVTEHTTTDVRCTVLDSLCQGHEQAGAGWVRGNGVSVWVSCDI